MSRFAKLLLVAATAMCISGVAQAYDVNLNYKQYDLTSPEAKSIWGDFLRDAENPEGKSGSTSTMYMATVDAPEGWFTVSMVADPALCGANVCPVRVFEGEALVFDDSTCANVKQHVLRPDSMQFVACDDPFSLVSANR